MASDQQGAARSITEMLYVANMAACEWCGDGRPVNYRVTATGERWVLNGPCARCRTERQVVFRGAVELDYTPRALELGGPEPSSLLDPWALIAEIDRLVPDAVVRPELLADPAWTENSDLVDRIRIALNELEKFIGQDADAIPVHAVRDPRGVIDRRLRPERYTRAWIASERQHWEAIAQQIADDAPRIFAADPILARATPPRGRLNRETVIAHRGWLGRGRTGPGRLDVVTTDADEAMLEGACLVGARLEGVWLRGADLRGADLGEAELLEVALDAAQLDTVSLHGATISDSTLVSTRLIGATLSRARIAGCSFEGARLDRTVWDDATIEGTSFRGARLSLARLRGAHFIACDFRDADLSACDFAGASLIGCAFSNAYGIPVDVTLWTVIDADFSDAADGSALGDAEDLLFEMARQ